MKASVKPITAEIKEELAERRPDMWVVEPVFGCTFGCGFCGFAGSMPSKLADFNFMDPQKLDKRLNEFSKQMPYLASIHYSLRGEPLAHPELHKITNLFRKHFGDVEILVLWGLGGVKNKGELIQRTKGITRLQLSIDTYHHGGLFKQMAEEGLLSKEALARSGHSSKHSAVLAEMLKRFRWALEAAKENGFDLLVRTTGAPAQRKYYRLFKSAFRKKELPKRRQEPLISYSHFPRYKRGSALGADSEGSLLLFHDLSIGFKVPSLKLARRNP